MIQKSHILHKTGKYYYMCPTKSQAATYYSRLLIQTQLKIKQLYSNILAKKINK